MNKTPSAFLIAFILPFTIYAQNGFEQKLKKDTIIDLSNLKATKKPVPLHSKLYTGAGKFSMGNFSKPETNNTTGILYKKELIPDVRIKKSYGSAHPYLIEIKRTAPVKNHAIQHSVQQSCVQFLEEIKPFLNTSAFSSFEIHKAGNKQVRMFQYYKGIEIYGKEIIIHLNDYGQGTTFTGNYSLCNYDLDTSYSLTPSMALQKVMQDLTTKTIIKELSEKEKHFSHYHGPEINKVVYETSDPVINSDIQRHIAYEIEVKPNLLETYNYVIDGKNGAILNVYNRLCAADGPATATAVDLHSISRTINTHEKSSVFYLEDISRPMYNADLGTGKIVTLDAKNTPGLQFENITSADNTWNSPVTVSAHYNSGIAYDYFNSNHNQNSINGAGGTIYSFVNVSDDNGDGLDNAYWNGQAIFYGNGKTYFHPLAKALDVAGHEMTHGVVQNTANLAYQGESGAINESMSDIFGFMMDSTNWTIGEDVVKIQYYPSGALRSLSDPNQGGSSLSDPGYQPKHVNEQYHGSANNGGVHINSGIPNHAFYILANSTSKVKAANIFYRALAFYLTRSSNFSNLRVACVQSAVDLFGENSQEVVMTNNAFDAVGILPGDTQGPVHEFPVNPGQEHLLFVDTYASDPVNLYRCSSQGSNFYPLTTTEIKSRPSITDNGSLAIYVGGDNRLYGMILTDPANPEEFVLQGDPIWSNASISKNGENFAAVTIDKDTTIYVYNFGLDAWAAFELYNPTYSEGVQAGGPVYADAMEWDFSGEYLVYDAYNEIENTDGEDINYWDVGFMKVWDTKTTSFGDGKIEKLFTNLPKGVSIGNASFSKNSPHIMAFDYIDQSDGLYLAVLGCNIETNKINVIFSNNTLGWPSYSRLDDKLVFTSWSGKSVAGIINLGADKISAQGGASLLVEYAKWPVFYADGERTLIITDVKDPIVEKPEIFLYPNPFDDIVNIRSEEEILGVNVYNNQGRRIGNNLINAQIYLPNIAPGLYLIEVLTKKGNRTFRVIKK